MKFIDQLDITGKKLLIRVDYNVPLKDGHITDDHRMTSSLPTLTYALEQEAAVIICCHLGKPKGAVVPELSLRPVAEHLSELLGKPVPLAPDSVGPEVETMAAALKPGQVMMLENLRFHLEETSKNIAELSAHGKKLAALADVYVNDAFGVAHRANASVVGAPEHAKDCCGGFLLKKEWDYLGTALKAPARPFVAISGGAKVSSKLAVLKNLLGLVDDLIIGGAMANTFLLAKGMRLGGSLVEEDLVEDAREIMDIAASKGTTLHLPTDFIYAQGTDATAALGVCRAQGEACLGQNEMVLDIGPETAASYAEIIGRAQTVVWNGPMGLFENPAFAAGSKAVCVAVAGCRGVSIVGGGDTDAMLNQFGLSDKVTFISTGGGSFMEFMEGRELPGFKALKECSQ